MLLDVEESNRLRRELGERCCSSHFSESLQYIASRTWKEDNQTSNKLERGIRNLRLEEKYLRLRIFYLFFYCKFSFLVMNPSCFCGAISLDGDGTKLRWEIGLDKKKKKNPLRNHTFQIVIYNSLSKIVEFLIFVHTVFTSTLKKQNHQCK